MGFNHKERAAPRSIRASPGTVRTSCRRGYCLFKPKPTPTTRSRTPPGWKHTQVVARSQDTVFRFISTRAGAGRGSALQLARSRGRGVPGGRAERAERGDGEARKAGGGPDGRASPAAPEAGAGARAAGATA